MGNLEVLSRNSIRLNIAGAIIFTVAFGIAMYLHPEFDLFSPDQSISDLGHLGDPLGYIFNLGVIISGLFLFVGFVGHYTLLGDDTFKKLSALVFLLALSMFILLGTFPKGTPYHNFFAIGFFLISTIAMALWCKSELFTGRKSLGVAIIILTVISYALYFNYQIVGFAFAELFGGYVIILWVMIFRR